MRTKFLWFMYSRKDIPLKIEKSPVPKTKRRNMILKLNTSRWRAATAPKLNGRIPAMIKRFKKNLLKISQKSWEYHKNMGAVNRSSHDATIHTWITRIKRKFSVMNGAVAGHVKQPWVRTFSRIEGNTQLRRYVGHHWPWRILTSVGEVHVYDKSNQYHPATAKRSLLWQRWYCCGDWNCALLEIYHMASR